MLGKSAKYIAKLPNLPNLERPGAKPPKSEARFGRFGRLGTLFLTAIELANRIRKEFVDVPSQFKDISDE
jgi:hypothetical protein